MFCGGLVWGLGCAWQWRNSD